MYQFYYAEHTDKRKALYDTKLSNYFQVSAIRPTMWEEHCLECSAPLCFKSCPHYEARNDGRCKRFANSFEVSNNKAGCNGESVRVIFKEWANMMTIIFPGMLSIDEYSKLNHKNFKLGKFLQKIDRSKLPVKLRWEIIRVLEYLRRRKLRKLDEYAQKPDAFIFQGFNFENYSFKLIVEIYDSNTPLFRTSLNIIPGENLYILDVNKLSDACWTSNYLLKIYPENNLTPEIDILWCDFVCGNFIRTRKPADKVKCLVWDLDNTVWNGILIETENSETLALRDYVLETIIELDKRGIIQSISSKNDFENTWPVIEKLGIAEYFIYPQINWNAKSNSIKLIAENLNIGIDSLAFIDDSEFERKQVLDAWPEVRVYNETEIGSLVSKNEFSVPVTFESKNRRNMYKAEEKRLKLKNDSKDDQITFLKKCHISIHVFNPENEDDLLRCYELVVRTNQLNMSGVKYTKEEFADVLKRDNHQNFAFSCKDDFGSYGIVGFGQYMVNGNNMVFTEFAMSCRVAGKMVESALFSYLLKVNDCSEGNFSVNKTQKNVLLRRTLEEIGFEIVIEDDKHIEYKFNKLLKDGIVCTD